MSTNYYMISKDKIKTHKNLEDLIEQTISKLKELGYENRTILRDIEIRMGNLKDDEEGTHIGKSSHGWRFNLAVDNFKTLDDIKAQYDEGHEIRNEYGAAVSLEELEKIMIDSLSAPKRDHKSIAEGEDGYEDGVMKYSSEGYCIVTGHFS